MKRIFAAVFGLVLAASALTQVPHDPNDKLYKDLDRWAARGYLSMMPPVRPYPLQLLDDFLKKVVRVGDSEARAQAQAYLDAFAPDARALHLGVSGAVRGEGSDQSLVGAPTFDGTVRPESWLSASYRMAVYGSTRAPGDEIAVPGAESPYADLVKDNAKAGPFWVLQDWTSNIGVGSASFYFQAGIERTSFGPFFDNGIVVGPQAGRAGHFDLAYRKDSWSFSTALLALNASDDFGTSVSELNPTTALNPDKYVMIHSLDVKATDHLEVGYFESVVWGQRFEYMYLAPFSNYFGSQSLNGFQDNAFMGFHFRWSPLRDFQALGQVYVDDFNFNDVAKLKLDTKYKLAAEAGIRWSPSRGLVSDLAADYTAVMPYMYTHVNEERGERYTTGTLNYLAYTHQGACLGADLEPNSDRASVRVGLRVIPNLDLTLSAGLQRHGNASNGDTTDESDSISYPVNNGSINDDGYTGVTTDPKATFNDSTHFLTQSVIETKASAGFGVSYTLPTSIGSFSAGVTYVFEYGWNREDATGAPARGNDSAKHYYILSGSYRW